MDRNTANWRVFGKICCCLLLSLSSLNMLPGLAAAGQIASISKPAAQLIKDEGRQSAKGKKLAVIIDDLGNGMQGTEEIMALPVKVTVAVMPFLPTTEADARKAHEVGHDVLIHLPLEPKQGPTRWLGPGAILTEMSDEAVRKNVEAAIDNVPYAIGINNHMGSKVTGDERVMSIILDVCRERGYFSSIAVRIIDPSFLNYASRKACRKSRTIFFLMMCIQRLIFPGRWTKSQSRCMPKENA